MANLAVLKKSRIAVDTNLLLLLVVGTWNPRIISRHKRLSEYSIRDFELVRDYISSFQTGAATAHVLTEVSNLIPFGMEESTTAAIRNELARTIQTLDERQIASSSASARAEFLVFGLTDAALSIVCSDMPLLTADKPLAAHLLRNWFDVLTLELLKSFRNQANDV